MRRAGLKIRLIIRPLPKGHRLRFKCSLPVNGWFIDDELRSPVANDFLELSILNTLNSVLVACLLIVLPSLHIAAQEPVAGNAYSAPIGSSADSQTRQLKADIEFLASEDLRGRSVTDDTIDQAADYIVGRMKSIGLDTELVDGGSLQPFSVNLGSNPGAEKNNQLKLSSDDDAFSPITAKLNDGLMPLALGSSHADVQTAIAFAGYGITAPKLDYDDYQGIDADGATVIILRKEPQATDPDSKFSGTQNTRHAFFATKIENAIKHGAVAVILVNDPGSVQEAIKNVQQRISQEKTRKTRLVEQLGKLPADAKNNRKSLNDKVANADQMIQSLGDSLKNVEQGVLGIADAGVRRPNVDAIPIASVSRDLISKVLVESTGKTLEALEKKINDTGSPQSLPLTNVTSTLKLELKPSLAQTSNVLGLMPGRGELASQTVVVGAHYDHVGMGGYGSLAPGTVAIHNGADDNASGTSAMLAIARQMKEQLADVSSHRQILFMGFTAEERGLLGSQHYVKNPVFPLETTVAMVNLDMVGRLRDNELTVYGTGSADTLDGLLEKSNERQQFDLFKVPSGYGPSDHQSFYTVGVPVLFFFTGLHDNYHRPTDDFDKINFGGLTRITDIVSEVTYKLAIVKDRPKYAETENRVRVRRQITAYMGVSLANDENSVVISGVVKDAPAVLAGLKAGDRLEKLGDKAVKNSREVLEFLRTRAPGQKLPVQVSRDGETISVTVELASRPEG